MTKIFNRNTLILTFVALAISFGNVSAQNKKLADEVKKATSDANLKHASVSVCVYNITQGKEEYAYDADRLMSPASLMKIFTTAAGFEKLGKN
ncbi:MAG: D-alanyl-D-alanine carboxypeptidase, partial [Bacteroidales bacterium]|nr:D-alanyl-D-alanine carboxypeptidase [Bacteroidales bacterium]